MQKTSIRKHHKWLGLALSLFLLMFCVSGLVLNHRQLVADCNVSRAVLPARYEFSDWNNGLLRGTAKVADKIVVYGSAGMFMTDSTFRKFSDFNEGLPAGADYRQIRDIASTAGGHIFAASPFALYRYGLHGAWNTLAVPLADGERITDVAAHGDTLVVLGRSYVYTSLPPYRKFARTTIPEPDGFDRRPTAFRTVWMLHSGELFGVWGKTVVDLVAIAIAVLCVTGIVFWAMKKWRSVRHVPTMRMSLSWHDSIGRTTIALALLVCITGWCLRPPLMIPLALGKVPAVPGSTLDSRNAWNDRLRLVRYDADMGDWLVSTSEGFYSLGSDISHPSPRLLKHTPPVSVMGLNVWQKCKDGRWICGSFSGIFAWDRAHGTSTDYLTGKPAPHKAGAPFGNVAVAGYTDDFCHGQKADKATVEREGIVVEYDKGTKAFSQPEWMNTLPMSLWNVALEIHSGRIYIGAIATYIFVFVMGIGAIWCLWTGERIRKKKK